MYDYDVLVIGCGPAGQKAAIKCAKVGRRVALADNRQVVGGQCLHMGTIPSKTMRAAIIYLSGFLERKIYGEQYRVKEQITADDLIFRCKSIIRREIDVIHGHLLHNQITVLSGEASFVDEHQVRIAGVVGTQVVSAEYIVICTGSTSNVLDDLPFNNVNVLNTDDILELAYLPKSLLIHGGGVIGLEYACMFSLLDMEVSVLSHYPKLLPWVDQDVVAALESYMIRRGVKFYLNDGLESISVPSHHEVRCRLKSGAELNYEMLMYAAPRKGYTAGLNLAAAGLSTVERENIPVNEHYQTAVPHIYAAGDVIGFPALASTAIDQGRKAANHLLGVEDVPFEPLFPYGIYTFPDISMVGASEQELSERGIPYLVGIGRYRDSARGQIIGDEDGLIKLLFNPDDRKLLGVHIIGSEATELIHIGQAVMIHGGKLDYFIDSVFNYPTLAETYKIAALNGLNKTTAALPVHL